MKLQTKEEEEIARNLEYRCSGESGPEGLKPWQKALNADKRERQQPGAGSGY